MSILELQSVTKSFGGITAVDRLSLKMDDGRVLGIIGPNGAGKTSIINLVTGFYQPTTGKILFKGMDITSMSVYQRSRLGIARTFQNIRLLKRMTVLENVLIGDKVDNIYPLRSVSSFFHRKQANRKTEKAISILENLGLKDFLTKKAGDLAYGNQRKLEIARSMANEPELLLLDEPAAGMNEEETTALIEDIRRIRSQLKGIIIVEHDLTFIKVLSDILLAVDYGKKITEGIPEVVLTHPDVVSAYLGVADE